MQCSAKQHNDKICCDKICLDWPGWSTSKNKTGGKTQTVCHIPWFEAVTNRGEMSMMEAAHTLLDGGAVFDGCRQLSQSQLWSQSHCHNHTVGIVARSSNLCDTTNRSFGVLQIAALVHCTRISCVVLLCDQFDEAQQCFVMS